MCYFWVVQITTLVNAKEKPIRSERTLAALVRVGQAVNLAVERFVSVGEAIAADNVEIQREMTEACRDARLAGPAFSSHLFVKLRFCSRNVCAVLPSAVAKFRPKELQCAE